MPKARSKELHLEVDVELLDRIKRHYPGLTVSAVLNELLFHFANALHDHNIYVQPAIDDAVTHTKESLDS